MRTLHCTRTPWSFTPPPDPFWDRDAHRVLQQLRLQLAPSVLLGRSLRPRRRYASPGLLLWCRQLPGWQRANLLHRWVLPLCGTLLWYLKSMLTQPCQRRKAEQTPTQHQKRQRSETMRRHSPASPGPDTPALPLSLESVPAPPPPPRPAPAPSVEAKPDLFYQYQRRTNRSAYSAKSASRSRKRSVPFIVEAKLLPVVGRRTASCGEEPSPTGRIRPICGTRKNKAKTAEQSGDSLAAAGPSSAEKAVTSRRQRRQGATHGEASSIRPQRRGEPTSVRSQRAAAGYSRISPELSSEHDEPRKRKKSVESGHHPISTAEKMQMRLYKLICQSISGNRRSRDQLIRSLASLDQRASPPRRSGRRAKKKRESWEVLAELPRRPKLTKPSQPREHSE
ncbi:hypothetical protein H0921_17565, partial [thermophilic bacterium 2918]